LPWFCGIPDAEALYHIARFDSIRYATISEVSEADRFVLVDASALPGLPGVVKPSHIVEVIDHRLHSRPQDEFPNARVQVELVGAAATLIAEKFVTASASPEADICAMLYGAIQSNTQKLRGSVTTARDIAACSWLESTARLPSDLIEQQLQARRNEIISKFQGSLVKESKTFAVEGIDCAFSQLEFSGAGEYLRSHRADIVRYLGEFATPAILNLVDVDVPCSHIIVSSADLRRLLEKRLELDFTTGVARVFPAILRKQMLDAIYRPNA
jgi:manganese-dependent inorganic pyrophosphatase